MLLLLLLLAVTMADAGEKENAPTLPVCFAGRYGQVEVGGPYAGVEFHHSRPLPSRISFYYPVANSIDLSTDYWRRGDSRPLKFVLKQNGQIDSIGANPWAYHYTPYGVEFREQQPGYCCKISYRFCQTLPLLVLQLTLTNRNEEATLFELDSDLQCILRTCQTYAPKHPARIDHAFQERFNPQNGCVLATAAFDAPETDSALVFVSNPGEKPAAVASDSAIIFHYQKQLSPGEEWQIVQLIGSCRQEEADALIARAGQEWEKDVADYERSALVYATGKFHLHLPDSALLQTARWSRAVLAGNRHYLDGEIVPMPCPAEYNFFFTHDLLLTDLGAVFFDCERVKKDLLYLLSLTRADSILPHAYYWRDSGFQTEFCTSDNWNHLWFIILTASYLRHSGDSSTVQLLAPVLHKSLNMMLENKGMDELMYAYRPDWWDIGHLYGARAYITTLMIRALREYVYIGSHLGFDEGALAAHLSQAQRMQQNLGERLWDEKSGFLLNGLDRNSVDHHYYAGSLLAAAWNVLDEKRSTRLLKTAAGQLLDRQLGIRIAMPADFHQLIDQYHFNGNEAGDPGLYLNGGIWPHGIVWYALGWLAVAEADSALDALKNHMTLEGIRHSPFGQPAFFEYRNSDAASPRYGEIDKPTFLWAGGWFLHALYQLAGLRENEWNLSFSPALPQGWKTPGYDVMLGGRRVRVAYQGEGRYFREVRGDGKPLHSAIVTQQPPGTLVLERGLPERPYLAAATCMIERVHYFDREKTLQIDLRGLVGQSMALQVISPLPLSRVDSRRPGLSVTRKGEIREIDLHHVLKHPSERIVIQFDRAEIR